MPKKERQISTIDHQSGVTVALMFNPNERGDNALTFSAKFADKAWMAKSADEVKQQVRAYLDGCSKLEWIPVIEVRELHPFHSGDGSHFVGVSHDRYYVAVSAETRKDRRILRKLDWDDYTLDPHSMRTASKTLSEDMRRIQSSQEFRMFEGDDIRSKLPFTDSRHHDGKTYLIAYSEETWAALDMVSECVSKIKTRLRELLSTSEGTNRLVELGRGMLKMLPPADEAKAVLEDT